ncbi:MAG: hypothetical protein V1861_02925 [Candidatus Micrarchaeota archaeon]
MTMERPKALICGMLEQGGKALFLKRKEADGEGIEMPSVYGILSADPVSQLAEAFKKQTGIKADVGGVILESRHEYEGAHIPCLVFKMNPLNEDLLEPEPAGAYSGFEWLALEDARLRKHAPKGRWLSEPIMRVD